MGRAWPPRRLLATALALELALLTTVTAVVATLPDDVPKLPAAGVAGVLAVAMGLQSGVARHLAVPDLSTTVLTMTLTGLASDLRAGRWSAADTVRRLAAVLALLAGAGLGALLVLRVETLAGLVAALALTGAVTVAAVLAARREHRTTTG